MALPEDSGHLPPLRLNDESVPVQLIGDFMSADDRRPVSLVSNFGDWPLPDEVAGVMAGPAGHLQWFHDTGELVLLGDIPRRGVAVEEIPVADTTAEDAELAVDEAADLLAGPLGGTGMVQGTTPETVEQTVLGSVVANDTRVAVLAVVEHGARVHALLWGWHRRHRRPEGWQWLLERLVHARGATRSG